MASRPGEVVASEVLDGVGAVDAEAGNVEAAAGTVWDNPPEGKHVGARAAEVAEAAPVGAQRGRAGFDDNLAEGHRDIERVAKAVTARSDADIQLGGRGGIDGLDMGFDVLGIPFVVIGTTTTGVETDHEGAEIQWKYETAIRGTTIGVELLGVEFVGDAVAPSVVYLSAVVELRGDREGVGGVCGISAAGLVVETCHIACEVDIARVTVGTA